MNYTDSNGMAVNRRKCVKALKDLWAAHKAMDPLFDATKKAREGYGKAINALKNKAQEFYVDCACIANPPTKKNIEACAM